MKQTSTNIASFIDHTVLKPNLVAADVRKVCEEAITYGFAAVCIPPYYISYAQSMLQESSVKIATVIGFPFGYNSTRSKMEDITDAITAGADEIDLVHNLAALKNTDWQLLEAEMAQAVSLIHARGKIIKVIVESGLLTDNELIQCCEVYGRYGIDFMKTSTGYAATGATVHAVSLMRKHLPGQVMIKASGGIRTFVFAEELINAGASRLGCSSSVQIVNESNGQ